jgi:hypothetical protein
MTAPLPEQSDNTRTPGPAAADPEDSRAVGGVQGGSADRLDSPGPGSGGVPGAGADGQTAAREQLREDLGERASTAGRETGEDLEQSARLGQTDDPQGGSIQESGGAPA